ncbi:Hypothetical predicted protein [Cloeon dipterum]|uniref:UMA domain-containing protein n=1 Tax=Cloeon dipterum TaxID=197152 RepID=A0A8S1CS89_9INSE|nr:Hypothetical predicted protein [Cloeon dipterum]
MSWLFGSKKPKAAVTSPSSESSSKVEVNEPEEDFVVVNKQMPPGPQFDQPPIYPNLSSGVNTLQINAPQGKQPVGNPLQGVPFKLSKEMGPTAGDDPTTFTLQVQTMIENINLGALDYDFGVERGVSREF